MVHTCANYNYLSVEVWAMEENAHDFPGARGLTSQQLKAVCNKHPRQLVVAAAGSGKTSVMVAKVAYVLANKIYSPKQVLLLAFNVKAAQELRARLINNLGKNIAHINQVHVATMHAVGMKIVQASHRGSLMVLNDQLSRRLLKALIRKLICRDIEFASLWMLFVMFYRQQLCHPHTFPSRRKWKAFVRLNGSRMGSNYGFRTVSGAVVSSQFEQAVGNWLSMLGISYTYRRIGLFSRALKLLSVCGHKSKNLNGYFAVHGRNLKIICILEGVSRCYKHSAYLAVSDLENGVAFRHLLDVLCHKPNVRTVRQVTNVLKSVNGELVHQSQLDFLLLFIQQASVNCIYSFTNNVETERQKLHAAMLEQLFNASCKIFNNDKYINYEGMLTRAAQVIKTGKHQIQYKLIMVDEFQDTSMAGVRLLKALLSCQVNSQLFAVGDDWQSIYKFAGAMPDVMSNFGTWFGSHKRHYLDKTFRFGLNIAKVSSNFVQANPNQISKNVVSNNLNQGNINIICYSSIDSMNNMCELCLTEIANDESRSNKGITNVYILGRYNHQKPNLLHRWQSSMPKLNIQFHTVHGSKGLEADAVIVLGLHMGKHGFPSQVKNDDLMDLSAYKSEAFPYAEERRLFYVAMTRTKGNLYLLCGASKPSIFINEIQQQPY